MKKHLWFIPSVCVCASFALAVSAGQRECWSMMWFWTLLVFPLFILTAHIADQENPYVKAAEYAALQGIEKDKETKVK